MVIIYTDKVVTSSSFSSWKYGEHQHRQIRYIEVELEGAEQARVYGGMVITPQNLHSATDFATIWKLGSPPIVPEISQTVA